MTAFEAAVSGVNFLAALVVFVHCAVAINEMTRRTHHAIRAAFVLLCVGEFAMMVGPIFGHMMVERIEFAAINAGLAGLFVCNRRRGSAASRAIGGAR